ncbi:MAG: hypothetical protein H6Q67_2105 [Firmicutes bacterium]|nr:hypothetical protein [Bacillota bacterium]
MDENTCPAYEHCDDHKDYEDGDHYKNKQTHVHEFLGSVKLAAEKYDYKKEEWEKEDCKKKDLHNHRFAGVSGEAIPIKEKKEKCEKNHIHEIKTKTDFYNDHYHEIYVRTGPAIPVGNGKHVHFVCGTTTLVDGHEHDFVFATLIENPIGNIEYNY